MKGNGFILRTPGGEILQRKDCQLIRGIHPRAFVMVPFDFHEENVWSMPITSVKQDESADANCRYPYPDSDTTEREHSAMVRTAIAFAAANRGKCIISTVTRRPVSLPPEELFARLEKRYPTVCTFLFSTTATGTWLGATPELLLGGDGKRLFTMSLAGTRPAGTEGGWDGKNREEQAIVTRFITDTLRRHGLYPEAGEPFSRQAGPVEHLCSEISAEIPHCWSMDSLRELLRALSPTPALGGFPRREALRFIAATERHQRGYYGGFFGLIESPSQFRLYVNLRSGRLRDDGREIALFTGGGITPLSQPREEWLETRRKARTLPDALS